MLAYVRAGLRHARGGDRFDAQVTVDGEPFFAGPAACVLVGNIGTLKAGVAAFPDASPTDGRLDVGVVTAAGLRQWAGVLAKTRAPQAADDVAARHRRPGHARSRCASTASTASSSTAAARARRSSLSFSVRPGALRLCAPAS